MIDRFNRNIAGPMALVAATMAGPAALSGCGFDGSSAPRHESPVTAKAGEQDGYTTLGVTIEESDRSRYALQDRLANQKSRYTMVADIAPQPAGANSMYFMPEPGIEQEYGLNGATGSSPTWQIEVQKEGDANPLKMFMPIATEQVDTKGGLVVTDQRPPGARTSAVSNQTYDSLLKSVMVPEAAYVRAAMDAGAISKVHFVYDADEGNQEAESSFFNYPTHEEVIVISRRSPTKMQDLIATETHETTHSVFGQTTLSEHSPEPDTSANAQILRSACLTIKATMFKQAAATLPSVIPYYQKAEALIPEQTVAINYIIKAVEGGKIADLQLSSNDPDAQPNDIDECAVTDPLQMIGFVNTEVFHTESLSPPASFDADQYAAVQELQQAFATDIRATQVLSVISEHEYQSNPRAGHPEEDVDELAASLVDIAVNYPENFKEYLGYLDSKTRAAVVACYNAVRASIVATTPSMANFVPDIFAS
jgi:hypothetical protein